jgi:hypothetical protein
MRFESMISFIKTRDANGGYKLALSSDRERCRLTDGVG